MLRVRCCATAKGPSLTRCKRHFRRNKYIHTYIHTYTHTYMAPYIHTYMAQGHECSRWPPQSPPSAQTPSATGARTSSRVGAQGQVQLPATLPVIADFKPYSISRHLNLLPLLNVTGASTRQRSQASSHRRTPCHLATLRRPSCHGAAHTQCAEDTTA